MVVAIIGVLTAVGVPAYQGYITDARVKVATENHRRIKNYVEVIAARCAGGTARRITSGASVWCWE